jgi:hypothetical protein
LELRTDEFYNKLMRFVAAALREGRAKSLNHSLPDRRTRRDLLSSLAHGITRTSETVLVEQCVQSQFNHPQCTYDGEMVFLDEHSS